MDSITLKWGVIKNWSIESDEAMEALQKYADHGINYSSALQKVSPKQLDALLEVIDVVDEIWLEYEGKKVSKKKAKEYVINYHKKEENESD